MLLANERKRVKNAPTPGVRSAVPTASGQRSEVSSQRSEVRGQQSEVRGQQSEVSPQLSTINSQLSTVPLNSVEAEVVGLFVQIARLIGLPRSVGEIYGLLFISARPLPMEELIARLGISKGSASMGLKFLRGAGAIHMVYVPNDRRMHFEAVAELRNLVTRFLRDKMAPHLDASLSRFDRISALMKELPPEEQARVAPRVAMLQSWEKNTRQFLPLVAGLLGK